MSASTNTVFHSMSSDGTTPVDSIPTRIDNADVNNQEETKAQEEKLITLNVSGRRFVTLKETLTSGSDWFKNRLSGRWNDALADRSYFVDADSNLFAYILQYLRRGIAPLSYKQVGGHDYGMYAALLDEAKYFQITGLIDWLEKKKYHDAVVVNTSSQEVEGVSDIGRNTSSAQSLKFFPSRVVKETYVCPRDIYIHRGDPARCGRACARAEVSRVGDGYEDEEVLTTLIVSQQTVIKEGKLVIG
ncbi:hypothetical protein LTS18_003500 [Coniosporium uncinatum]|uniref:Uncharacterized protein n=1 Tax=Coniosporium uncinatum TaxID=93489 RepID=A0ACC3D727_9PEZI|nr:hypothetical protein LTS18_003500 [Coniosporium uncinatum]